VNTINLHLGDKVLIKEHNKNNTLSMNWQGPFEIIMVHDNENITIQKGRHEYRIHKNALSATMTVTNRTSKTSRDKLKI